MGAVDIGGGKERAQRGQKKRPKKTRIAIRIDMTPMVDIAFLLLIFFMVTTVFRTPQAMEINLPPKDMQIPIAQSNIMTLRVLPGPKMFWNVGESPPAPVELGDLPPVLREESEKNSKLVILIMIHAEAKLHNMVDIIDELEIARVTRFSLAPLSPEDAEEVGAL
jgi:biopolymer transport protein ExbD